MIDDLNKDWNGTKSFFSKIPVKVGVGLICWWLVYVFFVNMEKNNEKERVRMIEREKMYQQLDREREEQERYRNVPIGSRG